MDRQFGLKNNVMQECCAEDDYWICCVYLSQLEAAAHLVLNDIDMILIDISHVNNVVYTVCPSYILIMSMCPPYFCEPWPYFSYQYTLNISCLLFQSSFIDAFWQALYIMTCWVNCSVLSNWNEFSDTFVLNYAGMMLLSGVIETILCGLCWYRNVLYILWIHFSVLTIISKE